MTQKSLIFTDKVINLHKYGINLFLTKIRLVTVLSHATF